MLYIFLHSWMFCPLLIIKEIVQTTQLFQGQVTAKLLSCPVEEPDEAFSTRAFLYPFPLEKRNPEELTSFHSLVREDLRSQLGSNT